MYVYTHKIGITVCSFTHSQLLKHVSMVGKFKFSFFGGGGGGGDETLNKK